MLVLMQSYSDHFYTAVVVVRTAILVKEKIRWYNKYQVRVNLYHEYST